MNDNFVDIIGKAILENYNKVSCGITVGIYKKNKNIYEKSFGSIKKLNSYYSNDTIYDLTSLTKPLKL